MAVFENIIERYEKTFSNHKKRSKGPFGRFFRKYRISTELWELIENNTKDNKLKVEARKNYIINIVTGLEVYIKDLIRNSTFPLERKKDLLKDKVSLWEAHELFKSKDIRTEAIIADYYSFQNLEVIDSVLSKLYGLKVLNEMENVHLFMLPHPNDSKAEASATLKIVRPKWREELCEIFDIRHESIHDLNFKKVLGHKKAGYLATTAMIFIMGLNSFKAREEDQFYQELLGMQSKKE